MWVDDNVDDDGEQDVDDDVSDVDDNVDNDGDDSDWVVTVRCIWSLEFFYHIGCSNIHSCII